MIYAELLANIRQISVIATIRSHLTSSENLRTQLSSTQRDLLQITYGTTSTSIRLPAPVPAQYDLPQQLPRPGSNEISWRLPLDRSSLPTREDISSDTATAPWPASKLSAATQVSCRKCDTVLLAGGSVKSWKDLPSENWAEMMDFWHCHKPSDHHSKNGDSQEHLTHRGYGANTKFTAKPGVGFVDLTYFLFSETDCSGIKVETPNPPQTTDNSISSTKNETLSCTSCNATLGIYDHLASGNRLYKWSLNVSALPLSSSSAVPPLSYFITSHLLAQIAAQAVHHFVLHSPGSPTTPILYIWVFMTRLTVSFSTSDYTEKPPAPIAATKVFFQTISHAAMAELLEKGDLMIEEVKLPEGVMRQLEELLRESNDKLPPSAKKFKEWDVGLLERFVEEG